MKLLIYGISGRTGKLLAEEALKRGHKVAGISRDKSKVNLAGAEIFEGSPSDPEVLRKAIEGCDAVASTLGFFPASQSLFGKLDSQGDWMSKTMKNTVALMKEKGLKRIVLMTALGVGDSRKEIPLFFRVLIAISNIRHAYRDHAAQEKVLEESGLDWTVVRPVMLTDDDEIRPVKNNIEGKTGSSVTRKSVASFILDCAEKDLFMRKKVGISN